MNQLPRCPACGTALPSNRLSGLCPVCTWKGLLEVEGEEPALASLRVPARGMRVPGYEISGEIARGGMGIVYRALQLAPERVVALKMLLPHQLGSHEMAERFRLEVRTLTELEHPGILPVYHVGQHAELPFSTMKLATGGTLAERKEQFAGQWKAIAELVATLADAIQFAHEHGVLHRDLKPGNVLFDDAGRPYVSDFGLAKLIESDTDLTRSADFLGTPHYVAPEIAARSAQHATTSSDLYSLGAILYELLAGQPPFEAEGVPALLRKIAEEEPRRMTNYPVPRDLEVICLKCLAKEPSRRYASARELADDLRRWLDGRPISARPVSAAERMWRWARRNPALGAVSLALFLTLIVAGVILVNTNRRLAAALRKSERAEAAALANLEAELLSQVRAQRRGGYAENPKAALALIARAAKRQATIEMRDEAVAALAAGAAPNPIYREFGTSRPGQRMACTLDISRDGRFLLVGTMDGVSLLDRRSAQEVWYRPAFGVPWMSVFFHPNGKSIIYSARNIGVNVCDFVSQEDSASVEVGAPTGLGPSIECSLQSIDADGRRWVVALDRDPIYIVRMDLWEDGKPETARTIAAGERMTGLRLSPDGRWAVSTTIPATDVRLWNTATGKSTGLLGAPGVVPLQFSPDGRWLVTRSPEEFRLWTVGTWKKGPSWPVEKASRAVARISFSPDGSLLAVPQTMSRFQLLETRNYTEVMNLTAPAEIHDAVWAHDGRGFYMLAAADRIIEWDFAGLRSELAKLGLDWEH